ncbi:MAG: tyrosine transporter, partial [Chlamydiae bacterium]|nr:tyrosine transporter [Chlamydiota bacterium]
MTRPPSVISSSLLIASSCIGVGMLGFPVVSALAGFMPATLAMLICYFFATSTGLLILEATLWFDKTVNLISIAKFSLGKAGKVLTWSLFLFLFYCIFIAYIDGGGQIFASMLSSLLHYPIPRHLGIITCVAFIGAMAYAGTKALAGINRLLILGLMISFFSLLSFAFPHIQLNQLTHKNWLATLPTLPIFLVSFGYQNLVPTLTYYAKKNLTTLRLAIFIGNLIPFFVYFIF